MSFKNLNTGCSKERDRSFQPKFLTKNRLFLRPQLSLKSKTITNQERIGCLVYPEITQINERSLYVGWRLNVTNKLQDQRQLSSRLAIVMFRGTPCI